MNNDPELSGKYLGKITKDFVVVADTLKEAGYQLKARKISDHPIFPISKIDLPIGQLLIGQKELNLEWNYNFSFLDEFLQREIVSEEMKNEFIQNFKNPDEFACLFVIDDDFTKFVFIPYPED